MYDEDDLLSLSGIQHIQFCPRQCALIHVEQVWAENMLTAEGRIQHEKVHSTEGESRGGKRIERGLRLRSFELGLSGQADVVEFYADGTVKPVEYKHGKPKPDASDEVQLCAQAVCLEEMLGLHIDDGFLFYGKTQHRFHVIFTDELRSRTKELADSFHAMVRSGITPAAVVTDKCKSCSLEELCLPASSSRKKNVEKYISAMIRRSLSGVETDTNMEDM